MGRGVLLAALALLVGVSSAQALVITGSGTALPGGGSCSISNVTTTGTGATVSCTGINLAAHTNVYFGIDTATPNGNSMAGAVTSSTSAIFRNSSTTASSITYTSTTTSVSSCAAGTCAFGSDTVTNSLRMTGTGTFSVVGTGGNPANSAANGDIGFLFKITSGTTLSLDVDVLAAHPDLGSGQACPVVYDPVHEDSGAGGDFSRVAVKFYWSDCGDGVIDSPEACDDGGANGSAGSCCTTSCTFKTAGTLCTDSTPTDCKEAQCTGVANVCNQNFANEPMGQSCAGNGTGECSAADTCNAGGTCLNNDFAAGTPCTDTSLPGSNSPNQCKDAQCNGTGTCNQTQDNETDGTACADGDFCTSGDTCQTGVCASGAGDPCPGPDGDGDCTETCVDTGFEVGNCGGNDPNGSPCTDGMFCNGNDTCNTGACTNHVGDPCTGPDNDTDCSESCDEAADNCLAADPDGTSCRASAGACDVAETCSSGACPADDVQPSNTVCNPGSGDSCDPAEVCDGVGVNCPADTITPSGTVCRTGSGDSCDPDETCTGTADDPCPADAFEPTSTVCRTGSGDLCDPDEFCPGVAAGTCAADVVAPSGTLCNAGSGDLCDPDETCSGTAGDPCPSDNVAPSGTSCRPTPGPPTCDVAESCTGVADSGCPADAVEASGTECRASTDVCDPAEACDGSSPACPADAFEPDGTDCGNGMFCDGDETCQTGACADGTPPCTFVCSEASDMCLTNACPTAPEAGCRTAGKELMLIKNKSDDNKDKFIWKFLKGAQTSQADFANPTTTATYALCIYAGTAESLVATYVVPPSGTKWQPIGDKGYKYKDKAGTSSGITKVILKGGDAGKTKALVKGKGVALPDPLNAGALVTPVTAQLLNHQTGICWETDFSAPKKNTNELFKAKQ